MAGQRHILQGQGVLVRPAAPAVLHPAGLGTQAPVAAAPPDEGGQVALPGVAHTQGPVDKGLDLNGGVGADIFDLVPAQLPGQHRPGHAQVGALLHPVQGVNGHLGGAVEMQVGGHLAQHPGHAQILNDDRVHPHLVDFLRHPGCPGQLPVGEQGIQRQKHLRPPKMAIGDRRRGLLMGKVFRVAARVEIAIAQIDGVRAVLDRSGDRLHGAGGSQQLQHGSCPPSAHRAAAGRALRPARRAAPVVMVSSMAHLWFCSLKISRLASDSSIFSPAFSSRPSLIWRRRFSLASCSLKN